MSSKAVTDQRQGPFLRKVLSDGIYRQAFNELCNEGMPAKVLESHLLLACFAAHHHDPKNPPILGDKVKNLCRELESCAKLIDRANLGVFAPARHTSEPYKKVYEVLPNIMRLYAATYLRLEQLADPLRTRRLTRARLQTVELLGVVVLYTGSPHYESLATLLTKGFAVTSDLCKIKGKRSQARRPAFFGAEALAKLYRSSAGLMPSKLPQHSPAPANFIRKETAQKNLPSFLSSSRCPS